MRFEREHNPETEIVASWFVSVSRSESSGNKVHSLVLEGFPVNQILNMNQKFLMPVHRMAMTTLYSMHHKA